MFEEYPTYDPLRPLFFDEESDLNPLRGEDVYALQCTIKHLCGGGAEPDGILGADTGSGIRELQQFLKIEDDGRVGPITWQSAMMWIVRNTLNNQAQKFKARRKIAKGQIQRESGFYGGRYSEKRADKEAEKGWSFDAGATQMNSSHWAIKDAFNPASAIPILLATVYGAYVKYADHDLFLGDDHSDRRRWKLAAGSWNAPYWANYFAGVKPYAIPPTEAVPQFETYMREAVAYL